MPLQIAIIVVIVLVLLVVARSLRVAAEWQRAVILRLGRFHKVKGPGIYLVFPVVDRVAQVVDLRIQTTTITAEQALTRDTVAVGVDAIVFWQVDDAQAAAVNIANYREAIERVAQTSLREMIGATDLVAPALGSQGSRRGASAHHQRKDARLGRGRTQRRDQGRGNPA